MRANFILVTFSAASEYAFYGDDDSLGVSGSSQSGDGKNLCVDQFRYCIE